jgi:hypothetical protein
VGIFHLSLGVFHFSFSAELSPQNENDKWQMENGKWKMPPFYCGGGDVHSRRRLSRGHFPFGVGHFSFFIFSRAVASK